MEDCLRISALYQLLNQFLTSSPHDMGALFPRDFRCFRVPTPRNPNGRRGEPTSRRFSWSVDLRAPAVKPYNILDANIHKPFGIAAVHT
jgi:hypothetical protein